MNRRYLALVAAGLAAMAFVGAGPAQADPQCTAACDKAFSTCNGSNPDTSACLPKWGQCKRACAGPITPAKTVATTPAAKVTKVADTKAKPGSASTKTAKAGNKK